MNFKKEENHDPGQDRKEDAEHSLNKLLLKAYNQGWNDCIAGDDMPGVDAQTPEEILGRIKNEPPKNQKIWEAERTDTHLVHEIFPFGLQGKYQKAIRFAGEKHTIQKVPGSEASYMVHVANVAMEIILTYHAAPDFDVEFAVQVALLHDTIEDTEATYDEVKENFGTRIADAVLALSKDRKMASKQERMNDSIRRIVKLEKEVGMVKLADRITNLQPAPKHWNEEKIRNYRSEAQVIYEKLKHCNAYLASRMRFQMEGYPFL